jgi:hypothetical protein
MVMENMEKRWYTKLFHFSASSGKGRIRRPMKG